MNTDITPTSTGKGPVRVLIVEDLSSDADLAEREIRKVLASVRYIRVETRSEFLQQLAEHSPDLIVCDFKMPEFDGLTALNLAREHVPHTPFIILTGSQSEDTAVECMKAGAWDYVIKEHLRRLGPAVLASLEQKQRRLAAEAALKKATRWEKVFETSQFGLALVNAETGQFIEVNRTFALERGYEPDTLSGKEFFSVFAAAECAILSQRLRDMTATGRVVFESVHVRRDGSEFPVLIEMTTFTEAESGVRNHVVYAVDISERARAETARRESEKSFRNLFKHHSAVKLIIDETTGRILDANDAAVAYYGWPYEALTGMRIHQISTLPPQEVNNLIESVVQERRLRLESKHRLADGSVRDVESFATRVQWAGKTAIHSIVHDITDRKRAEAALRKSETILRESQKAARIGSWFYDIESDQLSVTNELWSVLGAGLLQPSWQGIRTLVHREDVAAFQGWIHDCLHLKGSWDVEFRLAASPFRYIAARGTLLGSPEARHAAGTMQDITSRRQMEAERERLVTAIEQVGETVMMTNVNGDIEYVNPAFEEVTGYSRAEVLGRNPRMLKSGRQDTAFYRDLWATISAGKRWSGQLVNRKSSGEEFTEQATISPVVDVSGNVTHYIAVKRDITEQLKLEREFLQMQRMESVGRLAGGVAHDFNNLLTVINGYADLLLTHLGPAHASFGPISEIRKAGERAADLTQQLLAFSRKQIIQPRVLDLNDVVTEFHQMIGRVLGEDIGLTLTPNETPCRVRADVGQITQVLMNLAVNARDAMPQGGTLSIHLSTVDLQVQNSHDEDSYDPGKYVVLAIRDTGTGMDEVTRSRIFEPFFTTKEPGEGTGLGLATVYGIVKQAGGFIAVSSRPGAGTEFRVYLPEIDAPVSEPRLIEPLASSGGSETILVVEDQEQLRTFIEVVLESYGYRVLCAADGLEAIRMAEQHTGAIHLLLTDVVMLGVNGRELARRICDIRSETRVIFMSGYSEGTIARRGILSPGLEFLQKPFTPEVLTSKIRRVLGPAPARTSSIFIIEPINEVRDLLCRILSEAGYIVAAPSPHDLLTEFHRIRPDLIVADFDDVESGIVDQLERMQTGMRPVVAICGAFDCSFASVAARVGVFKIIPKPVRAATMLEVVSELLEKTDGHVTARPSSEAE